ncbi:MAG: hypothetical protein KBT39_10890 [Bacteroidales bacterium]|nr:hypothetical protein [Bacteroidales bacterium]
MKRILTLLSCVFAVLVLASCKHGKEGGNAVALERNDGREIMFVEPVGRQHTAVDSLMFELDELMQQYAAILSRSEQGEAVDAHLMAIQARVADFGLKLEMKMHDMSSEDIDRFYKYYDECIERMGMVPPSAEADTTAF